MNNVCLAGQVAVLFRRLVHVVSTVSVVQQYHFYKRKRSTPEHTSSQPTIECQDLSLGQTVINSERPSTISCVLVEQWSRLKGGSFWAPWRSSLMSVQQSQHRPNFSAYPPYAQPLVLLILLQAHLDYCHGSGQRDYIQPIRIRSPHPIKFRIPTPAQLRNPSRRIQNPTLLHHNGRGNQEKIL